jgi:GrpB-like predicted nucleotidyltransferase (UPF0157 family)
LQTSPSGTAGWRRCWRPTALALYVPLRGVVDATNQTDVMRSDPIVIVDYDPAWATDFETERGRVEGAMEPWLLRPVEHIGSTAVPGLAAKPIVDMVAVVGNIEEAAGAAAALRSIGWVHAPEPGDAVGRRLSFCSPSIEYRTHHLHVVENVSDSWRHWIAFRNYLRAHPRAANEYADLKRSLADEFGSNPNERDAYRKGKAAFIQAMTARAIESDPL